MIKKIYVKPFNSTSKDSYFLCKLCAYRPSPHDSYVSGERWNSPHNKTNALSDDISDFYRVVFLALTAHVQEGQ